MLQGCVEVSDLGSQFFLTEEDVGKNRATACFQKACELNSYVNMKQVSPDPFYFLEDQ